VLGNRSSTVILKWFAPSASGERTNQVKVTNADQFELKGQARELFEELGRIFGGDGDPA
jgi:hypothetical protein